MKKRIVLVLFIIIVIYFVFRQNKVQTNDVVAFDYSKEQVIHVFNYNKDYFIKSVEYINSLDDTISISKESIVSDSNFEYTMVTNEITYILNNLDIVSIQEDMDNSVQFYIKGTNMHHGILYTTDGDSLENSAGAKYEKIINNWYYFEEMPT